MAALGIVWDIIKSIPAIISAFKAMIAAWKQIKYDGNKKEFEEGTASGDQTKIEDSFDSNKAGKPSGHGTIVDE